MTGKCSEVALEAAARPFVGTEAAASEAATEESIEEATEVEVEELTPEKKSLPRFTRGLAVATLIATNED